MFHPYLELSNLYHVLAIYTSNCRGFVWQKLWRENLTWSSGGIQCSGSSCSRCQMEQHRTKAFGCWCMYSSTFFDWTGAYEIGSNTKVESGLIREGAFEYFVWILFQRWKHWREIRIVLIPTSIYSNSETPPKSATDVSVALRCIFSHVHRNDPDPTFSQSSFLDQTKTAKKALYLKLTSRLVAVDENEGKVHDYKVLEHQASFLLSGWDRCVVSAVKRFVGCFFVYELTLKTFKYQQAAI